LVLPSFPFLRGIEDIFKALRRLVHKGAENDVVHIERLYHMSTKAAPACFPNVAQQTVDANDWENVCGHGGLIGLRSAIPKWNRTHTALGEGCFRPTEKRSVIPKPQDGQITCTSAAHSQQVALEECLLSLDLLPDGTFQNMDAICKSWVRELVHTVHQTAVGLLEPTVLVDIRSGNAYLIILSMGRCLWGWPLRVLDSETRLLVMVHPVRWLIPIVLTSAHLGLSRLFVFSRLMCVGFHAVCLLALANVSSKQFIMTVLESLRLRYTGGQWMDLPVRVACVPESGMVPTTSMHSIRYLVFRDTHTLRCGRCK
jgi:hypothetical protein